MHILTDVVNVIMINTNLPPLFPGENLLICELYEYRHLPGVCKGAFLGGLYQKKSYFQEHLCLQG